jgi:hypothetical protein
LVRGDQVETNRGAIYDPVADSWTSVPAPSGWSQIGDAQSVVLPDGTFVIAGIMYNQMAYLNSATLTWSPFTSIGKNHGTFPLYYSEEDWTLLPNGSVLTVDAWVDYYSDIYNPSTFTWTAGGSTIVNLATPASCYEVGPAVLMYNGKVFALGATNNTSIYNTATGIWTPGPSLPTGYGVADGPAAPLPNGNVLIDVSPTSASDCYQMGSQFYEFDGAQLLPVPGPFGVETRASDQGYMLVLPTGQILFTDEAPFVHVYTSSGTYQPSWQPTIASFPATVVRGGKNYLISGTQFNGLSQGAMYGDDAQMATNYPLVRITNNATQHVAYARTHDHSTMGVATGSLPVSTKFDIPMTMEAGASTLVVVANGIPSNPVNINVTSVTPICAPDGIFCDGFDP